MSQPSDSSTSSNATAEQPENHDPEVASPEYLRCRVDHRNGYLERYKLHSYYGETGSERNSRLGLGEPDLVETVFVRRPDGFVRELPRIYDCRYVDYYGAPTDQNPLIRHRNRYGVLPAVPLESSASGREQDAFRPGVCRHIPLSSLDFNRRGHPSCSATLVTGCGVFLDNDPLFNRIHTIDPLLLTPLEVTECDISYKYIF